MRPNTNFHVKRNEITKIALELFVDHGYENTTITMIMQQSKLSKGGMYHYFASKEEILDAVIYYALDEELAFLDKKIEAAKTIEDKLIITLGEELLQSDFRKKFIEFKKEQRKSLVYYRIRELNAQYAIPYLKKIIDQGIEEGEFDTKYPIEAASVIFHLVDNIFYQLSLLEEAIDVDAVAQEKIDAFMYTTKRVLGIENPYVKFENALKSLIKQQIALKQNQNKGNKND